MKMQNHLLHRVSRRLLSTTNGGGGRKSDSKIPNLYSKIRQLKPPVLSLTQQELTTINLLIPRLCLSDQTQTALHLATSSLPLLPNTDPPVDPTKALSFSVLAHSLTSQPDMYPPMSLLTALSHSEPSRPHLPRVGALLVSSYLRKARTLDALKVYKWLARRGYPLGRGVSGMLVIGLLEGGMVSDALRVVREMVVEAGIRPGGGLRKRVYRGLLKEAVVHGAIELDKALLCLESEEGDNEEDQKLVLKKVRDLLDDVIDQLDG